MAARPRRLHAGPSLQEQQKRPVDTTRVGDLARKDRDLLTGRRGMIERKAKLVLSGHKARDTSDDGHGAILTTGTV